MTVAEALGAFACAVNPKLLPNPIRNIVRRLLFDVVGLCVAARSKEYIAAVRASALSGGDASAIGQSGGFNAYDAAMINGTAAHGEDFDDTFEGGPVHAGAVIVPAVLGIVEQRGLSGAAAVRGIAVGAELLCRMSLVAPQAIHKACFHPTAVIGAPAAAAAVASAIGLDQRQTVCAIGIAASLSSGIIEYLADGSSTKRLHAGNAAQAGLRAALLAEAGFTGPATVLEGTHGFYQAFAPSKKPDFGVLLEDLGSRWIIESLAFKPFACGTMTQPFVDCAIELRHAGVRATDIESMVCEVGEGTVHRLWEPLAQKQRPPNGYAGKFSTPYCIAVGLIDGKAGFEQFTDARASDSQVRALAAKVAYVVDPDNEYPSEFSGHIRATLEDGSVMEVRKSHMRGGAQEPLSDDEIGAKFQDNAKYGGWSDDQMNATAVALENIAALGKVDLSCTRG
jgi:2-methylcitrate dehydratase PrpD